MRVLSIIFILIPCFAICTYGARDLEAGFAFPAGGNQRQFLNKNPIQFLGAVEIGKIGLDPSVALASCASNNKTTIVSSTDSSSQNGNTYPTNAKILHYGSKNPVSAANSASFPISIILPLPVPGGMFFASGTKYGGTNSNDIRMVFLVDGNGNPISDSVLDQVDQTISCVLLGKHVDVVICLENDRGTNNLAHLKRYAIDVDHRNVSLNGSSISFEFSSNNLGNKVGYLASHPTEDQVYVLSSESSPAVRAFNVNASSNRTFDGAWNVTGNIHEGSIVVSEDLLFYRDGHQSQQSSSTSTSVPPITIAALRFQRDAMHSPPKMIWTDTLVNIVDVRLAYAKSGSEQENSLLVVQTSSYVPENMGFNSITTVFVLYLNSNGTIVANHTLKNSNRGNGFMQPVVTECWGHKICPDQNGYIVTIKMEFVEFYYVNPNDVSKPPSFVISQRGNFNLRDIMYLSDRLFLANVISDGGPNTNSYSNVSLFGCGFHASGEFCHICEKGYYFGGTGCTACSSAVGTLIAIVIVAVFVAVLLLALLSRIGIGTESMIQLVTFGQFLGVTFNTGISWPANIKFLISLLEPLSFSIDQMGLECELNFTFADKYILMAFAPLALLAIFGILLMIFRIFRATQKISKEKYVDLSATMWRGVIAFLRVMFLPLTVKAVRLFDCIDWIGEQRLADSPEIVCYSNEWFDILPYSIIMLLFFTISPFVVVLGAYVWHRRHSDIDSKDTIFDRVYQSSMQAYRTDAALFELVKMSMKATVPIFPVIFSVAASANLGIGVFLSMVLFIPIVSLPHKYLHHNILQVVAMSFNAACSYLSSDSGGVTVADGNAMIAFSVIMVVLSIVVAVIDFLISKGEKGDSDKYGKLRSALALKHGWLRGTLAEKSEAEISVMKPKWWYRNPIIAYSACIGLVASLGLYNRFTVTEATLGQNVSSTVFQSVGSASGLYLLGIAVNYYLRIYLAKPELVYGSPTARWIAMVSVWVCIAGTSIQDTLGGIDFTKWQVANLLNYPVIIWCIPFAFWDAWTTTRQINLFWSEIVGSGGGVELK